MKKRVRPPKKIKDADLYHLFGVPITTITLWKKRDDYRKNIYDFFKKFTRDEIEMLKNEPDISEKFIAFLEFYNKAKG